MPLSIPVNGELVIKSATKSIQGTTVNLTAQFDLVAGEKVLANIHKNWVCSAGDEPFAKALELMQAELDAPAPTAPGLA